MPLQSSITPLLSNRRAALAINGLIESMRQEYPHVAQAFTEVQSAVAELTRAMRSSPSVEQMFIADPSGKPIAYIGPFTINGVGYDGAIFSALWVGPNCDPTLAPFFCDGQNVIIGKNGQVLVQDAGGNTAATFGVTTEAPQTITAATNLAPSVITITGHGYVSGDTVYISGATGNTAINGYRIVVKVDADKFSTTTLAGVPVDGNGALTNTPSCSRYYAGVLAQTFATGASFANYRLRAFADGSLKIQNAEIALSGTLSTITLNPTTGALTIVEAGGAPHRRVTIASGQIVLDWDATSLERTTINAGSLYQTQGTPNNYGDTLLNGLSSARGYTTDGQSEMLAITGYSGVSSAGGPKVALYHARGSGETPAITETGDVIGAVRAYGYDGTVGQEPDAVAGIRCEATEDHVDSAHRGTKVVISATDAASGTPADVVVVKDGKVGIGVAAPTVAMDVNGTVSATTVTATVVSGTSVNASTAFARNGIIQGTVATVNLTGQTGTIADTALQYDGGMAPAGLYRISVALNTTTAGSAGTALLHLKWTGNGVARDVAPLSAVLNTLGAASQGYITVIAYSDGGADITYGVVVTGASGSPQYALQVAMERLS